MVWVNICHINRTHTLLKVSVLYSLAVKNIGSLRPDHKTKHLPTHPQWYSVYCSHADSFSFWDLEISASESSAVRRGEWSFICGSQSIAKSHLEKTQKQHVLPKDLCPGLIWIFHRTHCQHSFLLNVQNCENSPQWGLRAKRECTVYLLFAFSTF